MKKIFLPFILLALCIFSCSKKQHRIRFNNSSGQTVTEVTVGPAKFGTIISGEMTTYQSIPAGEHEIKGFAQSGFVEGKVRITGSGKHDWSLTLSPDSIIRLNQDK